MKMNFQNKTLQIYLVRHGESWGNKKQVVYGNTDYTLTDLGIKQAEKVAKKLSIVPFHCCYTSTLQRAYRTAKIALDGRDVPIIQNENLNEQFFGIYENQKIVFEPQGDCFETAVNRFVRGPIPEGELFEQMAERVIDFVQNILREGENNLIVGHNGPLGVLTAAILGFSLDEAHRFSYRQGCFSLIEISHGYPKLRFFNK